MEPLDFGLVKHTEEDNNYPCEVDIDNDNDTDIDNDNDIDNPDEIVDTADIDELYEISEDLFNSIAEDFQACIKANKTLLEENGALKITTQELEKKIEELQEQILCNKRKDEYLNDKFNTTDFDEKLNLTLETIKHFKAFNNNNTKSKNEYEATISNLNNEIEELNKKATDTSELDSLREQLNTSKDSIKDLEEELNTKNNLEVELNNANKRSDKFKDDLLKTEQKLSKLTLNFEKKEKELELVMLKWEEDKNLLKIYQSAPAPVPDDNK